MRGKEILTVDKLHQYCRDLLHDQEMSEQQINEYLAIQADFGAIANYFEISVRQLRRWYNENYLRKQFDKITKADKLLIRNCIKAQLAKNGTLDKQFKQRLFESLKGNYHKVDFFIVFNNMKNQIDRKSSNSDEDEKYQYLDITGTYSDLLCD